MVLLYTHNVYQRPFFWAPTIYIFVANKESDNFISQYYLLCNSFKLKLHNITQENTLILNLTRV